MTEGETVTVPLEALEELVKAATLVASAFDDLIPPRELGKGQMAKIAALIGALGVEDL